MKYSPADYSFVTRSHFYFNTKVEAIKIVATVLVSVARQVSLNFNRFRFIVFLMKDIHCVNLSCLGS